MVIVCPECTTKFRVNSERIPDRGAKVRCARCKHIFWAEKPAAVELPAAPITEPTQVEPEAPQFETTTAEKSFGRVDSDEQAADNLEAEAPDDTVFDYNRFREQDVTRRKNPLPSATIQLRSQLRQRTPCQPTKKKLSASARRKKNQPALNLIILP